MTFGEKIRELRRQHNITQEALAGYLHIAPQSISKWENNSAAPDIAHLVPLANIFNITLDALFDRDAQTQAADMEDYLAKDHVLSHAGQIEERINLWREALAKYPNQYKCMQMLAESLWLCRSSLQYSEEEREAFLLESIALNEKVFAECTDLATKFSALQILVFSYSDARFSCANEEKAVYYANQAPNFYCSSTMFLEEAYFTEENRHNADEIKQQNILSFVDCAAQRLRNARTYQNTEERIRALNAALHLWHALIDDGNFLFYHCRLADIHSALAGNYAVLGDKENTLFHVKTALTHAHTYDTLPEGAQYYTVPMLSLASSDARSSTKNYRGTDTQLILNKFSKPIFAFLQHDPEFNALLAPYQKNPESLN